MRFWRARRLVPGRRRRCRRVLVVALCERGAVQGEVDLAGVGEAGGFAGGSELGADGALGLEAAEFRGGAADDVVGTGAGSIYGALRVFVQAWGASAKPRFDDAATAERHEAAHDFVGEDLFENSLRGEFDHQGGVIRGEFVFFDREDVVASGVEPVFGGVAG